MARKNFKTLKEEVLTRAGAPERVEAYRQQILAEVGLHELRAMRVMSQADLAKGLHITQGAVSRFENGVDPRCSTLKNYVEGLGGKLEIRVIFDDAEVLLAVDNDD